MSKQCQNVLGSTDTLNNNAAFQHEVKPQHHQYTTVNAGIGGILTRNQAQASPIHEADNAHDNLFKTVRLLLHRN